MVDNSVFGKGERISLWETTELSPPEKADSPDQPLVTATIVSITEKAAKSRS